MDTDSFVLSVNTHDTIKELKNIEDLLDFSILNTNHELFSNKNKKVLSKFRIETPKVVWTDEFVCLRSKSVSFKCGNDDESKLKFRTLKRSILNLKNIKSV